MILILMQSRSGSSLVASIFAAHGYNTMHDKSENRFGYTNWEHVPAKRWAYSRKAEMGYQSGKFVNAIKGIDEVIAKNDCVKIGIEYWPLFKHLDPLVFTVRRSPEQIAWSLSEKQGRPLEPSTLGMVYRRVAMLDQARDESGGVDIQVEPLIRGDLSGIEAAFNHHGLPFDGRKASRCIKPKKFKTRTHPA